MKKTTILVVIFILGLLGASCSKADSPVVEWQRYMEAWNNENYEEMHLHLSEKSKGQRSVVDFEAVHEEFKEKMKAEQVSIKLSESFDEESIAEAIEEEEKIILPFEGEINSEYGRFTYQGESSWVYEDEEDRWMLEWDTGYLYTDYEESDRVETYYEMPQRGAILDSKGEMLAGSDKAVEIGIVPGRFTENKETVIAELAAAFELMQEQIEERLNLSWVEDDSFVDLLVVRYEELDTIEEIHEKSTAATYRIVQGRTYPKKDPFAHLVGYLGYPSEEEIEKLEEEGFSADHKVGRVGLEQAYEEQLRGLPGRKIQLESKDGEQRELLLEEQVQDGKDVKTTIRSDLQEQLYQALDGEQSAGSVIDHQTGEILALVSTPAYDNNEFSLGMSSERFQTLQNRSDAPLRNRFANTYSPGSTMKGITGAIGLDGGFIDKNFTIDVNGKEWQKDGSWGGYHVTRVTDPGRPINIEEAYIYSDNIFFAQTALRIGAETFIDRAKDFGIGRPLQTAYQWRTSQLANGQSIDKEVLLADTGYGQGQVLMSVLDLARAYTPFVNEGKLVEPYFVDEEKSGEKEQIISAETAESIRSYLTKVVTDSRGTGNPLNEIADDIGGKTGTAEIGLGADGKQRELGWFMLLDQSEQTPYITTVMIEEAQNRGGSALAVDKVKGFLKNYR